LRPRILCNPLRLEEKYTVSSSQNILFYHNLDTVRHTRSSFAVLV
jgi:hypothetical protein